METESAGLKKGKTSPALIKRDLEAFFRQSTKQDSVLVSGDVVPLTGGFDTEVFAFRLDPAPPDLAGKLVLRLYRLPRETTKARIEALVQNAAADGGHPVPRVVVDSDGHTIAGRPFIVMEHVPGIPLVGALDDPEVMAAIPRLLARVQASMHSSRASGLISRLEAAGIDPDSLRPERLLRDINRLVDEAKLTGLQPLADWLNANCPEPPLQPVVCHGDLHPANIMVQDGEVTGVIDWPNVAIGHAEFDVAITRMIMSIGPVELFEDSPPLTREQIDGGVAEYVAAYRQSRRLDDRILGYYSVLRAAHAFVKIAAARVAPDLRGVAHDQYAWQLPVIFRTIVEVIERETGIAPVLPEPA